MVSTFTKMQNGDSPPVESAILEFPSVIFSLLLIPASTVLTNFAVGFAIFLILELGTLLKHTSPYYCHL